MVSLRELQESFAAALRDPAVACAVLQPANLAIYRNNSSITWRQTLESTYPVLRRRVGDDFFRQLCVHYRERVPSHSGDLHWYGRDFPGFLTAYLEDPGYAWLADLACLEWSCAECSVAAEMSSIGADALAPFPPEQLECVVFRLQPSLRLHSSSYPVFTVWETNRVDYAPPVDQSIGKEQGMVHSWHDLPRVRRLDPGTFSFLSALAASSSLGDAVAIAGLDGSALTDALARVFREGLVTSLTLRK